MDEEKTEEDRFLEVFDSKDFYLDEDRLQFIKRNYNLIKSLKEGKLVGQNRYKFLLLGRKSVGKTTLLERLKIATETILKVYVVYINFGLEENTEEDIMQAAGRHFKNDFKTVTELETYLETEKKKLVFLMDEIQYLYTENKIGSKAINQLYAIGDSQRGNLHCIITGSSSILRLLCFAKLPNDLKTKYPNYQGRDLNSTKFVPYWIYPFFGEYFVNFMSKVFSEVDTKEYANIYLKTAGYPGLVQPFLIAKMSFTYSISDKGYGEDPTFGEMLNKLYHYVSIYCNEEITGLEALFPMTTLVPVSSIFSNDSETKKRLYFLSDQGLIRYNDEEEMISFTSPIIYFSQTQKPKISPLELCYLKMKDNHAEDIVMRLLALNSNGWTVGTHIPQLHSNTSVINLPKENERPPHIPLKVLCKEKYEKGRDCFGNDFVILDKVDKGYNVHLLQLKLGVSEIPETCSDQNGKRDTLVSITQAWKRNQTNCENAYKRLLNPGNEENITFYRYLVTTRNILPVSVKKYFGDGKFFLIGKEKLESIWPEEVKLLGKPYK